MRFLSERRKKQLLHLLATGRRAVRKRVPPGFRWIIGLILIVLSAFSFLPVLGLWMLPLGIVVAAMDIGPLIRRYRAPKTIVETPPPAQSQPYPQNYAHDLHSEAPRPSKDDR